MFDEAEYSVWAIQEAKSDSVCQWAFQGHERVDCIEAIQYKSREAYFKHDHLDDAAIEQWVNRTPQDFSDIEGGLRILICERHRYNLDFPIQKKTFENVLKAFKLSPKTLQLFDCDAGTYSRFNRYGKDGALNGIDIILKAPQKREIGNYGLSMHYDVHSGLTTALLFGTDIGVCGQEHYGYPSTSREVNSGKREEFNYIHKEGVTQACRLELLSMIRSSLTALRHPLFVPCLILEDHMRRTQHHCEHKQVCQETWEIMHELGLRGDNQSQELFWVNAMEHSQAKKDRFNAKKLTARMDRQVLRILYTERSPKWNHKCSNFMRELAGQLDHQKPPLTFNRMMHETLREGLESNMLMAESISSRLATMKESMMLQLDVLVSIVGQSSNEWTASISWETARDSTSMKILALITAFFLPATFVATLFSMNMFNWLWQDEGGAGGDNTESGVVSHRIWIYAATAVPLTLLTLAGWVGWWAFEMRNRRHMHTNGGKPKTLSTRINSCYTRMKKEWRKRPASDASDTSDTTKQGKESAYV